MPFSAFAAVHARKYIEMTLAFDRKSFPMQGMHHASGTYIICITLLIGLTIANVAGMMLGAILFFVPYGLRSFVLAALLLFLVGRIYVLSERQSEIKARLWLITKIWLPFIIYLAIRTEFSPVGIWKFAGFIMRVYFPCLALIVLYINDKTLFIRHFVRTLLVINIILALCVPFIPTKENLHDVSIWLSRGIAVSVFFLIINLKFDRRAVPSLLAAAFLFGTMLFIGARGPVAALLITLVLYFGLRSNRKIITWPLLAYAMCLVIVLYQYVEPIQHGVNSFLTHGHQITVQNFADDRLAMLKPTYAIFKQHPLVGTGLGNWVLGFINMAISDKAYVKLNFEEHFTRDYYYYPHNIIFELLSELGLIGILLFLVLFAPYKHIGDPHNPHNYLIVMGLLFALTSSDLVINSAPLVFNTLSWLEYRS